MLNTWLSSSSVWFCCTAALTNNLSSTWLNQMEEICASAYLTV